MLEQMRAIHPRQRDWKDILVLILPLLLFQFSLCQLYILVTLKRLIDIFLMTRTKLVLLVLFF